ncbi:MAG TPA: hypothetical protein VF855_14955 [Acidimicrobiales bacterium]
MWIDPEVAGYVEVQGGRIWYRANGLEHADRSAVVCITGGPGMSHHYMYPFLALADERPVVLYDQLDTGNADRPGGPTNWRIERFVDEIYLGMNGPSEFTILGEIRYYEREDDLGGVDVPTLITCGDHDNARPETCRHYASLLPKGEVLVLADAGHFTFVDRPDEYIAATRRFLADHDL